MCIRVGSGAAEAAVAWPRPAAAATACISAAELTSTSPDKYSDFKL